jgi:hypothetical protein
MTEQEWLNPGFSEQVVFSDRMLAFLRGQPNLGRKRRLLAVACCQRVLEWMPDECLPAVALAERLAEGPVDEEERWAVYVAAGEAYDVQNELPRTWAGYCAYRAVETPSDYEQPTSWDDDAAAWVAQVAAQPASWVNGRWDLAALVRERRAVAGLIRDIFGNPFRPVAFAQAWRTPRVVGLAQAVYDGRAFERLPLLADELERASCREPAVLAHCRQPGTHVRGCWVVDSVLGKS